MKKLGSIESILKMLPIGNSVKIDPESEKRLKHTEAIILSMTSKERKNYRLLNGNRKKRIAKGSGTTLKEVNNLIRSFDQMYRTLKKIKRNPTAIKKMMKQFGGNADGLPNMPNMPF